MADYQRKVIADGVAFSSIIDPKFKSIVIQVRFITELCEETAARNAQAFSVLAVSNEHYKNVSDTFAKLNSMYGTDMSASILKRGDLQLLSINIASINNRYALEKEDICSNALDMITDCIFSPYVQNGGFGIEPFDYAKKGLMDHIEAEINNKRSYAVFRAYQTALKGEKCALAPYGTKETANAVTPQQAYEAYKDLLKTAQVEIYYVGSEYHPEIELRMTEKFRSIERSPKEVKFISFSPIAAEVRRVEEKLDVNQCKMVMIFKSDNKDRFAMRYMNAILGGTPFSKLFLNVREKLSLCYYCASAYGYEKGVMNIDLGVEEENIEKAQKEILAQIECIKNGDITDDEMKETFLSIKNRISATGDTPGSYIQWYYGNFVNNEMLTPEDAIEKYRQITKEQIIEAAKSLKLDTVYLMKGE